MLHFVLHQIVHHWSRAWSWCGQSERDESRTGPEPRCVGPGDGAGGSAVVGLDSDAGLSRSCWMKLPQKAGASAASGAIDRTACIGTHARAGSGRHPDTRGTGTNARRYTHARGACPRSGGPHGRTTHATSGNANGCAIRRCQGGRSQQQPPCRRDHCLENGALTSHGITWIRSSILTTFLPRRSWAP